MKKLCMNWGKIFFCLIFFSISLFGLAQPVMGPSSGKGDSALVNSLLQQSKDRLTDDPQKAINLAIQAKELAEKIVFIKGQAYALKSIGLAYYSQAKYPEALQYWRESLNIFENINDETGISNMLNNMAAIYFMMGDDEKALEYSLKSLKTSEKLGDKLRMLSALNTVGNIYFNEKATKDKALDYLLMALPLCEELGNNDLLRTISQNIAEIYFEKNEFSKSISYFERSLKVSDSSANSFFAYNGIGNVHSKKGDFKLALSYLNKALSIAEKFGSKSNMARSLQSIANVYIEQKDYTAALNYYNKATVIAKEINAAPELKELYKEMAVAYSKTENYKNAFKYQSLYSDIKDTLYTIDANKKMSGLQFEFDIQKRDDSALLAKNVQLQELRFDKITYQNKFRSYFLLGSLAILLLIAAFLFRNNRQKQKAKLKIEQAYSKLKDTQQQLIQREKMASMGELTAGIAHEIQNPLNFVNNFSEVSVELLDEMEKEFIAGNKEDGVTIAADVKQNLKKINHHGKRADAIVKGMLQHSRSSSGVKEPTDITALADEYLRLAYHGLRAKDKSFNATMKTDFDETIGNINIIPQDMGRVILNLITNAFYAVTEKKKQQSDGYEPIVSVSTKKTNGKVEITVKDNGNGIPQKLLDKIFQPFFTTKPTGEGTGLGLSLSYDIVTKGHGGDLKVKNKEGEGAEFIITLPY